MQELHARVTGRVQRVMFRDFTARNARTLGLRGTVQNLPDGSVAVVAQGDRDSLAELLERLHKGSLFSRVDGVEMEWVLPEGEYDTFSILY